MPTSQGGLVSFFPFILIFVIFYFLLIRPQKQQQKKHEQTIANLKKNDEVVTTGGIHGTIVNVKDKTFVLRVDDNSRIEIDKNAVGRLVRSTKE